MVEYTAKRFYFTPSLFIGDLCASVSTDKATVLLSKRDGGDVVRLSIEETLELRDWLSEVLPINN